MGVIQDRFKAKADTLSAEVKDILHEHGDKVIGEVKLSQIYQGMRGMTGVFITSDLIPLILRSETFSSFHFLAAVSHLIFCALKLYVRFEP